MKIDLIHRRRFGAGLLLGALPCAAIAQPAAREPQRISLGSPAWHIFWFSGNAPRRQVYLIDARHQQVADDIYEVQAATLLETPRAEVEHWAGTLQVQATPEQIRQVRADVRKAAPLMKDLRVRTLRSYILGGDGKLRPVNEPTPWDVFKTPIDLLTLRIASDANAIANADLHGMAFIGNFHRAVDAVDVVRKVLPNVSNLRDAR